MSTISSKTRKLSSIVKCGRCRQDRQKCVRPDVSQKCLRCTKYKHDCDSGRASDRAQRTQRLSSRQRAPSNEQRAAGAASTPAQCGGFTDDSHHNSIETTFDIKIEENCSSQTSRSASFEQSTSWSALSIQEGLPKTNLSDTGEYAHHHGPASSAKWNPGTVCSDGCSSVSEYDASYIPSPKGWSQAEHEQRALEHAKRQFEPYMTAVTTYPWPAEANIQMLSGLTNIRPSRNRSSTPFEERLNTRIDRLWGNYKTFATASSKGLRVSLLFGRTLSELFRQSKQMAENGDDLVADVRYACGAADACMNQKLPENTRAQYLEAYRRYDARANVKYHRAVNEFAQKIAEDESPDVLPLYTATFLYYAAGACMKGGDDLIKATFAFEYFNRYTAWFPIRLKVLSTEHGTWGVDMLLANNSEDPGMRINTLMFALGRARLEFDRKDGLCQDRKAQQCCATSSTGGGTS